MHLYSVQARLRLLSELRHTPGLASLTFSEPLRQDWRRQPIDVGSGWIDLLSGMVDLLLALPEREWPSFRFLRARSSQLEMNWFDGSRRSDVICHAAMAQATYRCEWCSVQGRRQETPPHRVFCRTHAEMAQSRRLDDITAEERVAPGKPYPRPSLLVDVVIGIETESGRQAALVTDQGEQGFDLSDVSYPAGWLIGTSREADLYVILADGVTDVMDQIVFPKHGERRKFQLNEAEPILRAAAQRLDMDAYQLDELIAGSVHWNPKVRGPAFQRLIRLFSSTEK